MTGLSVRIEAVSKQFPGGTQALNNVSLTVEPGEGVVLLGPNGSGKSTLLRCLVGLEKASSGSIHIGDIETITARGRTLRELRSQVGYVFQRFNLVGNLSVFHNVLHGAMGRNRTPLCWWPATAPAEERERVMDCLEQVGLATLAGRRADTLSGGQQQRLAMARMLMQSPRLVLADEPIANLDPKAGREVMDLLWSISRRHNMTVICALHQLELARQYADRLVGLQNGRVVIDESVNGQQRVDLERLYYQQLTPRETVAASPMLGAHD